MSAVKREAPVLVIGVGNDFRGDDAAGLVVAQRLQERYVDGIAVLEAPADGASFIDACHGTDAVILIDAVRSGSTPGTIHRLSPQALTSSAHLFRQSTHAISIADAVGLAEATKKLPKRLIVVGIEGKRFETGVGLSPEVEAALPRAVHAVLQEARAMMGRSRG